MKRLYNVIFPIWFILIMPPIVFLVLPSNFIIDSLVLILAFKFLKMTDWFNKYKKIILRVWIIGFIVDIIGSLFLLATQFISTNDYLYKNLVYPLAWNPFKSVLAVIFVLFVVLLCGFLIYFINYKFSFKKVEVEEKQKKIISLIIAILTAPYLFFLPTSIIYKTNETNNITKYQDSYVGDNSAVGNIIKNIYSGDHYKNFELKTEKEPYGIVINYKEDSYGDIYKNLEEDALILFKLIKNVSFIDFKVLDKTYSFDTNYVENIYPNIKEVSIEQIYKRYNNEYFKDFTYFGHIDKYDIFDTSTTCGMEKSIIYSDDNYNYLIECSSIDTIYLVNGGIKIKLKTAVNNKDIQIEQLFKTNLKISKENKK